MLKKHFKHEISVIIGHYGHGNELQKCLNALKIIKKNIKSIEFILIDNNEDMLDSNLIKNNYKWIKYINKNKNFGWGGARNLAIKYASGKYIYFCDSDILINLKSFKNIFNIIKNKVSQLFPIYLRCHGDYKQGH